MKLFKCQHCAQLIYFENIVCEKCSHRLGFVPEIMTLSALEPEGNAWRALTVDKKLYRFCTNAQFDVCNWMVEAGASGSFRPKPPNSARPASCSACHFGVRTQRLR